VNLEMKTKNVNFCQHTLALCITVTLFIIVICLVALGIEDVHR